MSRLKLAVSICVPLILLLSANTAGAAMLFVNCGAKTGLTSIGAALKVVQGAGPSTIRVSGACRENVVIQGLDRLTLKAVNGASISDASGGMLDVISIDDSWDVAINGFTINAGTGDAVNGMHCGDFSVCRLSGNLIQGANGGAGLAVFGGAEAALDGDTFQNNAIGLQSVSGAKVRSGLLGRPVIARNNGQGIRVARGALVNGIEAIVENNSQGVVVRFNSTLDLSNGSISNNATVGVDVGEDSAARFTPATITNNGGPGVLIHDLSMVTFDGATVSGNGGGTDVVCEPQFSATRGTADIGGGTTNCVEP